jgi:hypothetical protein
VLPDLFLLGIGLSARALEPEMVFASINPLNRYLTIICLISLPIVSRNHVASMPTGHMLMNISSGGY